MANIRYAVIPSPLGPLHATFIGDALSRLDIEPRPPTAAFPAFLLPGARRVRPRDDPVARQLAEELRAYFDGRPAEFRTKLSPCGTPFQRRVWAALREVAFGETVSYGEVARRVGAPQAARAVGQAVGANPVPIIVPCHRVVCSSGALGGFTAGLAVKRWLLRHERESASRMAP